MKLGITLNRSLDVCAWRVIGQVARATKRIELLPLLVRVRDRGESDAHDIAEHLFFESRSRKVVAERLLRIAMGYRLVEENQGSYRIAEAGHDAIETEQVFVPEYGTWTIWASDDPLLESPILRVEPWSEPSAYDEIWGKERDNAQKRSFRQLPSWLRECVGQVLRPCAAGDRLRFDKLEDEGEAIEPGTSIKLEWTLDSGHLRAEGSISGERLNAELPPPNVTTADAWRQLLESEQLWRRWDRAKEALLVDFDDTDEVERASMARTVDFHRPHIDGYGAFDPLTVSGVQLAARSSEEAERWARWRLEELIGDYATEQRFEAWTREAAAPFHEYPIELPARDHLAQAVWRGRSSRPTPRTWHLIAAEDWRL